VSRFPLSLPWLPLLAAVLLTALLVGCGPRRGPTFPPPPEGTAATTGKVFERGKASWYGPGFHGKRTANGETFNTEAMTAAHKTLPFDTHVHVTNLENGRTVVVRINDRGPFIRGRIIDLSKAAARELEMLGPGVVRVELRRVTASQFAAQRDTGEFRTAFSVQVGAFTDRRRAEALALRLEGHYGPAVLESDDGFHRVRVGVFPTREQAREAARRLRRDGHATVVVSREIR
jgi:rare lipoprotein A